MGKQLERDIGRGGVSERIACIEGQCRDQDDRHLHSSVISWDTDEDTRMWTGYPETTRNGYDGL